MSVPSACLFVLLFSLGSCLGSQERNPSQHILDGLNVCLRTRNETFLMNVTHDTVETVQSSEFCWSSLTFRCSSSKDVVTTKYRQQNVTRRRSFRACCEGYHPDKEEGRTCLPSCEENPCLKGKCTEPGVCTCDVGYSGLDCSDIGCPDPFTWGQDCTKPCSCESDTSSCNPKDGSCQCYPGYEGETCNRLCPPDTYGKNCAGTCRCSPGSRCHHVTGNCVPCDPGYYGDHCRRQCSCDPEGTLICHPGTGFCICKPGHYGHNCEDHCPFGMKDGTCYKEPIPGGIICACRDEVAMACDPLKGCVCQVEGACEDYSLPAFASNAKSTHHHVEEHVAVSSSSIALSVILVLACLIVLLGALYYRRRFKRAQKDLHNRVVFTAKPENNTVANEYEPCVMTHRNEIPKSVNNQLLKDTNSTLNANNNKPGPSSENLYEEIASPSGSMKNNELLSAYYKKYSKQTSVNDALRDPLYWNVLRETEAQEEDKDDPNPKKEQTKDALKKQ